MPLVQSRRIDDRMPPKKSTGPRFLPGPFDQGSGQLAIALPLPAVPCGTVLQAPEGEHQNYRLS
jgi:hypothetical protein